LNLQIEAASSAFMRKQTSKKQPLDGEEKSRWPWQQSGERNYQIIRNDCSEEISALAKTRKRSLPSQSMTLISLIALICCCSSPLALAYSSGAGGEVPFRRRQPSKKKMEMVPLQSSSTRYFTSIGRLPPLPTYEKNHKSSSIQMQDEEEFVSVTYTNNPKVVTEWLDQNLDRRPEGCVLGFDVEVSKLIYLRLF
jgi:hypothetical protein